MVASWRTLFPIYFRFIPDLFQRISFLIYAGVEWEQAIIRAVARTEEDVVLSLCRCPRTRFEPHRRFRSA
ncbi:hypothetical protein NDU88_008890 [Pleurodeles waltl]|uniref:Uncharacterized protein n=1 Tax=Pleurodeles waltl TaxID=8319 RepID=A0AAV7QQ05_PLEWA|nr:hypothetical protein NDU88_008890 [Pleurodeles waltl]